MLVLHNRKGFTLMEIIIAIAIIAIVSGPLLHSFITSSRVGRRSYDMDQANSISVQTVEAIKGTAAVIPGSRMQYFDSNWNGPYDTNPDKTYPFCMVTEITGVGEPAGGSETLSFLPDLICKSGSNKDQSYRIKADCSSMNKESYCLTLDGNASQYTLSTEHAFLCKTLTGSTASSVTISKEDCVTGIIPLVVDVADTPNKQVAFHVDNHTNTELALYIFGETSQDDHCITANPMSGAFSIHYMNVLYESESKYDTLTVHVKVFRAKDDLILTDYTTLLYLPA